jgi:large subunit ribosomal protein L9
MAVVADKKNVRALEHEIRVIQQKAAKLQKLAVGLKERVEATQVSVTARVGEEEKLFGSVTSKDIAEALKAQGLDIDRRRIVLSEPIKSLGVHEVTVKLGQDVSATVKVTVAAEGGATAPAAETPAQ